MITVNSFNLAIMSDSKFDSNPRKYERIISGELIKIRQEIESGKFGEIREARVVNYSLTGCCLIIPNQQFTRGKAIYELDLTKVKAELGLIKAEVLWYKQLENYLFKVGFRYIK